MAKKREKLEPLENLKFETIGDELVYLYEKVNSKKLLSENIDNDNPPDINELRTKYNRLVSDSKLKEKYSEKSIYWSEEQEEAIVDFVNEEDEDIRNKIFNTKLYKPFKKLIENIIFNFKLFRTDIDVIDLQTDCMSFLITKLEKFNPDNGTKSFAYFGTIAKHYLMGEKKALYKSQKNTYDIDEKSDDLGNDKKFNYSIDDEDDSSKNIVLFNKIIEKLEKEIENPKMLPNDKKVGEAIIFVFKNHELLEVYNKNFIYHLIKERTRLQTKEITYSLSRFKSLYKLFKSDFLKEG